MNTRTTASQLTAFALAALVTLGVLMGLGSLAGAEQGAALLARATAAQAA